MDSSERFWSVGALLTGIGLGFFLGMGWSARLAAPDSGREHLDTNGDGRTDAWYAFEGASFSDGELDRNYDGSADAWETYDSTGFLVRLREDQNFDGQADSETLYRSGKLHLVRIDTDFDGAWDATVEHENGVRSRVSWHPGGSEVVERVETYTLGRKAETLTLSGETAGKWIKFDLFGRAVKRGTASDRPRFAVPTWE